MKISNEKREVLKEEFIKGFSEEGFYLVTDREYGVFADWWLSKLDQELSNHTQRVREEIFQVREDWRNDGQIQALPTVDYILSIPSLQTNPTKDNEKENK